jgi:outer membrane protein assembly factor BamB
MWLPDKVIQTLAAQDGAVYIATRDGLAAFDTRTLRWTVRYFRRTTVAGSIVHELADRRRPRPQ